MSNKLPKLLAISGPTATGKTALAVEVSKMITSELVSVDSRQIYIGLDIGVGKDHPKSTPIHLIDIIKPDKSFSVSNFKELALTQINKIIKKGKLPILVGCSGFYLDSIIGTGYQTFKIKPKRLLRFVMLRLPLNIQKFLLKILSRDVYNKLNNSDINNPLRLIRKIEIALSKKPTPEIINNFDILHISLTAPNSFLYPRIDKRVESRLTQGHMNELKTLISKYNWSDPGLKVSAYKSFEMYLQGKESFDDAVQKWKYLEHRDARRQKTWFKKRQNIKFVDISRPREIKKTLNFIDKWYNKP